MAEGLSFSVSLLHSLIVRSLGSLLCLGTLIVVELHPVIVVEVFVVGVVALLGFLVAVLALRPVSVGRILVLVSLVALALRTLIAVAGVRHTTAVALATLVVALVTFAVHNCKLKVAWKVFDFKNRL